MGAKITLVGTRTSKLRKTEKYFAFEMNLGGSKNGPKGLPTPSQEIQFTVFVSHKAGKKIHLENLQRDAKLLIQGELALDIPMKECPGEIGVIAFQISEVPPKEDEKPKEQASKPVQPAQEKVNEVVSEVAAALESPTESQTEREPVPEGKQSYNLQYIDISKIQLPEKFQNAWLNPEKTAPVRELIQKTGKLDKPLEVKRESNGYWLIDGYRRYVIALEIGFHKVPVRLIS